MKKIENMSGNHNGIESILLGHTNGKGGSGGDHGGDV